MKRVLLALAVLGTAVLVLAGSMGAPATFSARQEGDLLRDGTGDGVPDLIRARDGSCAVAAGDQLRLRDGTGDGIPDLIRARDGSCQDAVV